MAFPWRIAYNATMATKKTSEQLLTKAEMRAMKFMGARLEENEARYREFIDTLDPRERERLVGNPHQGID
jgi:nitrate reductase assembly molybdenum cofactor insertion protein NarJ